MMLRLSDVYWVCWREIKRFVGQKVRILMTVVQPLIWLLFVGNTMSGLTSNPFAARILGVNNYLAFMTPGIMIMTALFGGIFGGMSIVWDRRLGLLNKMLAAPISRAAIPLGKMLAAGLQSMLQVTIITAIAMILGVRFACGVPGFLLILVIVFLFSCGLSGISLSFAAVIKSHETLMATVNFLTMPMMFTSNAMFPTEAMPTWLRTIARWNPLSYAVGPIRTLTTRGLVWGQVVPGLVAMFAFALAMSAIAARQFERSTG
ncbi:MAG: ABC transporter permease [Firmicutes bacterium]|nr:ABC transporter permease [Bacillota bacterium]